MIWIWDGYKALKRGTIDGTIRSGIGCNSAAVIMRIRGYDESLDGI